MARKTKAEAEQTRQRILDAAEQVFFTHGVMQTSLDQVAEAAGVTRGAIYWHFADKVALFKALHESVRLPQEDLVNQVAVDGHPDPIGFLEEICHDCIRSLTTDPRLIRVYAILLVRCEYVGEMAEALKRQQDADEALRDNFVRLFRMARANGSLGKAWTPEVAAQVFASMIRGLWSDWLRYGQSFDLKQVWPRCVSELCASFRERDVKAA